ncbi:MAG TPA: low molecular weight phosphatase family protein [Actinomycetota bacterium]|nr:low molecular weight phosphatase family protein [Actinomycetota bacterium]
MFRICFVCTGNRCRSPVAAGAFERFAEGRPVEITSAGILEAGHASPKETVRAAREVGIELDEHRSRTLGDLDLSGYDLVIGFEFDHIAAAVVDHRARRETTFGLREIVDLLEEIEPPEESDPVARAGAAIQRANERRGDDLPRIRPVPDPYGLPLAEHRRMVATVNDLSERLARGLFGAHP